MRDSLTVGSLVYFSFWRLQIIRCKHVKDNMMGLTESRASTDSKQTSLVEFVNRHLVTDTLFIELRQSPPLARCGNVNAKFPSV